MPPLSETGKFPVEPVPAFARKPSLMWRRIADIEKVTKHDVIAFLESLMDSVGPEHRFLHMGLTSSDIVDTSLAVQMTEALDLILEDLDGVDRRPEGTGPGTSPYGDGGTFARHPWRTGFVRL